MKINFRSTYRALAILAALAIGNGVSVSQLPAGELGGVKVAEQPAPTPGDQGQTAPSDPAKTADEKPSSTEPKPLIPAETAPTTSPTDGTRGPQELSEPASDLVVELVKERYPSGSIKIEREMVQDAGGNYRLHGQWRHYDQQGRLVLDGRFATGQKEGLWRRFYEGDEAELLDTAPYKEFTPPFISSATFHAGVMHGKWTITDSKQRIVHELEFCDGERHGKAAWYYPNGVVMLQARYEHGRINGDVVELATDGSVAATEIFQSGRKLAPKTEYFDDAEQVKKQEITYLHAMLVVKDGDNWDNGTLATFETRGQDEKHGTYSIFYSNGQLAKQGEFRYNLPVGKVLWWYSSGQKQMEGTYVDGRQEGVWTWWHENGQRAITGEYHDSTAVGSWSWWTQTGKLSYKTDLSQDRRVVGAKAEAETREAKRQSLEPGLPRR
jgi:antitoxin component YwqK of YwqJK toxin-antitoxin module